MRKEDLWWLLWGVAVAFGLQVLYDGVGEFPNYTQKFVGGLIIDGCLLVGLGIYGIRTFRKSK